MCLKRVSFTTFAAAIVATAVLFAQGAADNPPVVLKATTRLVQLSVIARDHAGKPLSDLRREDFQVKVNGKPQPIRIFSVESSGALPAAAPVTIPKDVFTNRLETRPGAASAVTIILLDTRNTALKDQIWAKAQIIRYLRTLQPGDHIGLYTFGGTLRVVHDYTSDSSELLNRVASSDKAAAKELPDTSKIDAPGALEHDSLMLDSLLRGVPGASPAEREFYTTDRVYATLRAFEFIARHLAEVPGRKNLIWVSGGFPLDIGFDSLASFRDPAIFPETFTEEVDRTMRVMNDANIAVYPVDARGLMTDPSFSAENRTVPLRPVLAPAVGVKEQETMQEVASRTGGQAFYNTNDLARAIGAAVDDSRVTYTIGFYPADENFDGKFHKIDVETTRSGVKLRYRKGYVDLPEEPQDAKTRDAELRDAVWSPLDASAVGIIARVAPSATDKTSLDVTLRIDHESISLQQGGTSDKTTWNGRLDILLVQRDDQGKQYGGISDTVNMNLTQPTFDKLQKDDLVYHQVVLRAIKAKMLRIVVRDAASGAVGSVTIPLAKVS